MSKFIAGLIENVTPSATSTGQSQAAKKHVAEAAQDMAVAAVNGAALVGDVALVGKDTVVTVVAAYNSAPAFHGAQTALTVTGMTVPAFAGFTTAVSGAIGQALIWTAANPLVTLGAVVGIGIYAAGDHIKDAGVQIYNGAGNIISAVKNTAAAAGESTVGQLVAFKEYLDPDLQNGSLVKPIEILEFDDDGSAIEEETITWDEDKDLNEILTLPFDPDYQNDWGTIMVGETIYVVAD